MNVVAATPRYRAFISYSHHDKRWADWLFRSLESWRAPTRLLQQGAPQRLAPIFRDRDELPTAANLGAKVRQALKESTNLIVICSPQAAQSRWVNEEVRAFQQLGRGERIFCLVVAGEPGASAMPGHEADECLVPALRHATGTGANADDLQLEPMAADVRPGKDGRSNALLKLIAGMLGIEFDALKQREHQRRVRRMSLITAAAVLIMLITSVLAVNAMLARSEAARARQAAEQRQDQAEQLVNFMLGDFNDKLREANRLDMLQTVNAQAMAYFASLPNHAASDATLQARATALQRIGSVRMDQGLSEPALQAFRAASAIDAELLRRAPNDPQRQARHAHGLNWIGNVLWFRGDLEHALEKFEAASMNLEQAANAHPEQVELQAKLASARTNTGRVLEARGEFKLAKHEYLEVLRVFESLSRADPGNSRWAAELGYAYNNLGKLAQQQGDLAQSIEHYRADHAIKVKLAAREPDNKNLAEALVLSNGILGQAMAGCGDTVSAMRFLRAAVGGSEALVDFDPEHTGYQRHLGDYSRALATVSRQRNELAAAAQLDQRARRTLGALVAHDPTNMAWQRSLALSQLEGAHLHLATGDIEAAQAMANSAAANIRATRLKQPDARISMLIEARTRLLLGQIASARNDPRAARTFWLQAHDSLQPLVGTGADPDVLDPWASTLLLLGDESTAQPVISRLWKSGYRDADFVALVTSAGVSYLPNEPFIDQLHASLR